VNSTGPFRRLVWVTAAVGLPVVVVITLATIGSGDLNAGGLWGGHLRPSCTSQECLPPCEPGFIEESGTWYWLRSPEEEKRFVASLFNRYCIRCHGVDGRGVWDIPDVPDFTNARWQAVRSDSQLARVILEGRGAVMPPFRGTLSLEEACAMGRYLRTFIPGTEASRPNYSEPKKADTKAPPTPR